MRYIEEESFFDILLWAHCAISGLIVAVCASENVFKFYESHTPFVYYSSCSKTPIIWKPSWKLEMISWSYIINIIVHLLICPLAFYIQYMLFKKHKQLEKQRAEGIMVTIYNQDNVIIQKRSPDKETGRKLTNFFRTVVTPTASFLSSLILFLQYVLHGYIFFSMGTSGPQVWGQFAINLRLFVHFFLHSLTETIFSPTVQRTLIDVIPCRRRDVYPVVTV